MELRSYEQGPVRRGRWMALATVAVASIGIAATTKLVIDSQLHNVPINTARAVAREASGDRSAYAVTLLLRDMNASADVLLELAERDDPVGVQARLALHHVRQKVK